MSLEKKAPAEKAGKLELDLDSLSLDKVSERYRAHLEELQAWFKMTDDVLKVDSNYEQSGGRAAEYKKASTK